VRVQARLSCAVAITCMLALPAVAADQVILPALPFPTKVPSSFVIERPIPSAQMEFAARFWYGNANTSKSLFAPPSFSSQMVSRLTYKSLNTYSGELYGRVATWNGMFVKGYVGAGDIKGGHLQDEDFPPIDFGLFISPDYSSTNSDQHSGTLVYASGDLGYDVLRGGTYRVGLFAGYHYFNESVKAFGCTQTAGNPFICQPSIPASIPVIKQDNQWQAVRLGVDGSIFIGDRFALTAEAVWLPYLTLDGADNHLLRPDLAGGIHEDGTGRGYQLEALLSYKITPFSSVGVGGRYWHVQSNGNTHFEAVGGLPQPVNWKSDIFGVFLQGSLLFGVYPDGDIGPPHSNF
jgi:hypothetical protein